MTTGSLRLRLFGLAAATIALALGLAWLALTVVFERHVKSRINAELANQVIWIAANLTMEAGRVFLRTELPDPRFRRPLGGLYWQIEPENGRPIRSRSLWDEMLPRPPESPAGVSVSYEAAGLDGRPLLLLAETLTLGIGEGERSADVIVAADYAEVEGLVAEFGREIAAGLLLIGLCLTAAAAIQVRVGLAPLDTIRAEIAAIRARRKSRLDPDVPSEVRPLVEEVNQLLNGQDEALARARAQAGDLAHGLKTPLTILSTVARNLDRRGNEQSASEVLVQIETMRRRLDRQLARARLGPERRAVSGLKALLRRLVSLMRRTPDGKRVVWEVNVDDEAMVAADGVDVAEAIGNILENACKWARTTVRVSTTLDIDNVAVLVEDDGPGVPDGHLEEILARGARLDEQKEGSGLGLAIVSDITKAYGAKLELSRSGLGGLAVRIAWPRAGVGEDRAAMSR